MKELTQNERRKRSSMNTKSRIWIQMEMRMIRFRVRGGKRGEEREIGIKFSLHSHNTKFLDISI